MASPAIAGELSPYGRLWREFQQEIRRQVCECNAVAEDALWTLLPTGDGSDRITVASSRRNDDRVECSLDAVLGFIDCMHGGGAKGTTFRFRCADGLLLDGDHARTIAQASSFVLGHLVGGEDS
jgi:hypothetical protein